jgi:hypothetical protein
MSSYAEQQHELNRIAEELTRNNDLWKRDDFGGVATGPTTRPRRDDMDFGGLIREERFSLKPADFNAEDFEELGRRDPAFKKKLDDQKIKDTAAAFMAANPSYVRSDENFDEMLKYLRRHVLKNPMLDLDEVEDAVFAADAWTVETLTSAFKYLKAKGRLEVPVEQPKELSNEERLRVTVKIREGKPEDAIMSYLRSSLPGRDVSRMSFEAFASEYPQLLRKIVWTVFREMHPEMDASAFQAFYDDLKGKALPTIQMLESVLYQRKEDRFLSRSGPAPVPASPSPEPEEPRQLTEDEIRSLSPQELDALIAKERKETIRRLYQL